MSHREDSFLTLLTSRANERVSTQFSGTVMGESAMVNGSDVGSLVEFSFRVSHRNVCPDPRFRLLRPVFEASAVLSWLLFHCAHSCPQVNMGGQPLGDMGTLAVELEWPFEVANGKWLLYLMKVFVKGESELECKPGGVVNPLNLTVRLLLHARRLLAVSSLSLYYDGGNSLRPTSRLRQSLVLYRLCLAQTPTLTKII